MAFLLIRDNKIVSYCKNAPPSDDQGNTEPDWVDLPDDHPLVVSYQVQASSVAKLNFAEFREQIYTSDTYNLITGSTVTLLAVSRLENLMFGGSERVDLMVAHWNDIISGLPRDIKNLVVTKENVAKFNTAATYYKLPFRFDNLFTASLVDR